MTKKYKLFTSAHNLIHLKNTIHHFLFNLVTEMLP